eukprot:GHVS01005022.1.p1 GENE.GHVS01005022.1~~GHVS01005022.1.p1  ORF type:complete len:353 (-),score=130.67 GHVS01005022.1:138-1136(-)
MAASIRSRAAAAFLPPSPPSSSSTPPLPPPPSSSSTPPPPPSPLPRVVRPPRSYFLPCNFYALPSGRPRTYLRRFLHIRQMDFDFVFAQLIYLLVHPRKVYQFVSYHHQTKRLWSRDDPCFLFVLCCFLAIAGMSYSIAFSSCTSIFRLLFGSLLPVFVFLFSGVLIASLGFILASSSSTSYYITRGDATTSLPTHNIFNNSNNSNSNNSDSMTASSSSPEAAVEWLYFLDVHANASFPFLLLCPVIQYFLLPAIFPAGFAQAFVSNSIYALAVCCYWYVSLLGYSTLPPSLLLARTELLLCPAVAVVVLLAVCTLLSINMTRLFVKVYQAL